MGAEQGAPRTRSVGADVARTAAFFVLTLLGALLGRLTYLESIQVVLISPLAALTFIWLASGSPRREWRWDIPALTLAQVCAVLLTQGAAAPVIWSSVALTWVLPVTTVLSLRRLVPDLWGAGGSRPLSHVRDLVALVLACAAGSLLSAGLRYWGLGLVPPLDLTEFAMAAIRNFCWTFTVGIIALQVGPAMVACRQAQGRRELLQHLRPTSAQRLAEGMLIVLTTAVLYVVAFELPVTFAISLVTVWAAQRFSPVVAELHAFASGTTALLMTLAGVGVFAEVGNQVTGAALTQGFMIVLVLTAAVVALSSQERRRATERAVASDTAASTRAALLDAVITHLQEGVVVMRVSDGTELIRNPAGRTILQLPEGQPYDVAMPAPNFGIFDDTGRRVDVSELPHAQALVGVDSPPRQYLVRAPQRPEGVVLEISATHLTAAEPDADALAVINFRDVTRESRERDSLVAFAGVVAHDLTNPLSVVDGWAEALADAFSDGPVSPEDGEAMVARIRNASGHMRQFITDLLNYTVARDKPLHVEDVDLSAVAEGVAMMRRQSVNRPKILVEPAIIVHADQSLVRQLIDNLIGNAVKYVAPGVRPDIVVAGSVEGDQMRITVTDNGIGIPPTERARIFENFQRLQGDDYAGTGIGLAICQRIVERHGGTIRVDDNPHGRGSRFSFTLPVAPVEETPDDQNLAGSRYSPHS